MIQLKSAILASFAALLYSSQSVASFLSLLVLMLTGIPLKPYTVFMVLALINTTRVSVACDFANAVYQIADFSTAIKRIGDFLKARELSRLTTLSDCFTPTLSKKDSNKNEVKYDEVFIEGNSVNGTTEKIPSVDSNSSSSEVLLLSNVTSAWNCDERTTALRDFTLKIFKGELVIITGPVGSGKSALLGTILGELNVIQGEVTNPWHMAFVSQCPWVFTGSIRENILFGKPFNDVVYQAAVKASQLLDDLENLSDGDLTMVGERGVVLSGGQRSRVGLARALYLDADLYLLDDPLSAVDAKVGKQLFEDCVCGILNNKTRVLVTHQLQYVKVADRIVVMNSGKLVVEGSYKELMQQGVEFEKIDSRYDESSTEKAIAQSVRNLNKIESGKEGENKGLNILEEDRMIGTVSWKLYWKYFRAGLSVPGIIALVTLIIVIQGK